MKSLFLLLSLLLVMSVGAQNTTIKLPAGQEYTFNNNAIDINSSNTLIGQKVGKELLSGLENTFLGSEAGLKNKEGSRNTFIGYQAGYNTTEYSGSVMIGYQAGLNEKSDDVLYISNSDTNLPLIYGNFRTQELTINRDLTVANYFRAKGDARVDGNMKVDGSVRTDGGVDAEGVIFGATLNAQSANPLLSIYSTSSEDGYWLTYDGNSLNLSKSSESENSLVIEDGDVSLPHYAGSETSNLGVDASGKLIKHEIDVAPNQLAFNRYEFTQEEDLGNAYRIRKGVQFKDGTVLTGLTSLMLDNDFTGSSGIANTVFMGLYRANRHHSPDVFEVIFRVDGQDTPTNQFSEFATTNVGTSGSNVIDNENYIYVFQSWFCDACAISEVRVTE